MFSLESQIPPASPCISALSIQSCSWSGIHEGFLVLSIPLGLFLVLKLLLKRKHPCSKDRLNDGSLLYK